MHEVRRPVFTKLNGAPLFEMFWMKDREGRRQANQRVERFAGSHPLAAAAHPQRYATEALPGKRPTQERFEGSIGET